ncbi:MAG: hypothetical protein H6816_14215 [Phycisphaerales bacterium]|nr:hypothetical protein [Phycisphaerales bacterium]
MGQLAEAVSGKPPPSAEPRLRGYSSTVDRQTSETSQQEYQDSVAYAIEQSERALATRSTGGSSRPRSTSLTRAISFSITNIEVLVLAAAGLLTGSPADRDAAGDRCGQPDRSADLSTSPHEQERGPII